MPFRKRNWFSRPRAVSTWRSRGRSAAGRAAAPGRSSRYLPAVAGRPGRLIEYSANRTRPAPAPSCAHGARSWSRPRSHADVAGGLDLVGQLEIPQLVALDRVSPRISGARTFGDRSSHPAGRGDAVGGDDRRRASRGFRAVTWRRHGLGDPPGRRGLAGRLRARSRPGWRVDRPGRRRGRAATLRHHEGRKGSRRRAPTGEQGDRQEAQLRTWFHPDQEPAGEPTAWFDKLRDFTRTPHRLPRGTTPTTPVLARRRISHRPSTRPGQRRRQLPALLPDYIC